ncbi:recombinase family protein [Luteibacter sp. RCC_6_2]|uniref:recombinase family protein n=1 Tax=Luteibacter sp. RCC_6_2 TaxID=3239223 RepID=UPI00352548AD
MKTAAYARYSSDNQRDASLEDQLRNCRAYCARMGWPEPVVYTDAAVSGARLDREAYQRLLADAHRFDVLLVDDLSRFGRDSAELTMTIRRLTFAGVRLIGVSDGVDTQRKSHKADVGLRGLMSEMYLDDLADKVHRGLTGRALSGASAGGLPYGYRVTAVGQRAIDEDQAAVVRRIYAEYIAGASPREIVTGLNRDKIPSSRGGDWYVSAVFPDRKRGIGILANPIYAGRQIWNRSHFVKHPDSGRRLRQSRPETEWVITERPDLAIVDSAIWDAAQARASRAAPRGPKPGMRQGGPGRPMRHLLSGILRCGQCGAPMVIVDRYRYGCSVAKDRGASACSSTLKVPREPAERALLAAVQAELLTEEAYKRFAAAVIAELKRAAPDTEGAKRRLAEVEKIQANIMAAIKAGVLTQSTREELVRAEREVEVARADLATVTAFQPTQILPRARETWRRLATDLADGGDARLAREALIELIGESVHVTKENGAILGKITPSQINLVAGVGFEPTTFGL